MEAPVYEYKKYVCSSDTLWSTLQEYGVAIIPSVLSTKECDDMVNGMWDVLEHITQNFDPKTTPGPMDRNNESTWRSFYELFPSHSMLVQHWGIGHAPYIWELRQNPKILKIWTDFWGLKSPNELLVSFDAVSYHLPPEITNKGWYAPRGKIKESGTKVVGWLHSDQSYTRNDFECVQSWVTGLDVNDGDASLVMLEGSHKYHGAFAKKFNMNNADFCKLSEPAHYDFYIKGGPGREPCPRRVIKCPKGSLVFWDSRTIHSGQEAVKTRSKPNIRSVVYLCYSPRVQATDKALEKKVKYFEEQRMTNHWPHKIKVFGKTPYTRGIPIQNVLPLPKPVLKPIGKYLAGYSTEQIGQEDLDEDGYIKVIFID